MLHKTEKPDWMTRADYEMLSAMHQLPDELKMTSPAVLADNLDYSPDWISRRLAELNDRGLVETVQPDQAVRYQISELGRQLMAKEIPATEFED